MPNRNKSYNEILAKKFDNLDYAQGYLLHIYSSENTSVDKALRETIKAMGLQSFADKSPAGLFRKQDQRAPSLVTQLHDCRSGEW